MAKNKPSLLDSIATMKAVAPKRPQPWYKRLQESDPKTYDELIEVALDFNAKGVAYQKLGSQVAFLRCLQSQGIATNVSQSSFDNFVKWVGEHGKESA